MPHYADWFWSIYMKLSVKFILLVTTYLNFFFPKHKFQNTCRNKAKFFHHPVMLLGYRFWNLSFSFLKFKSLEILSIRWLKNIGISQLNLPIYQHSSEYKIIWKTSKCKFGIGLTADFIYQISETITLLYLDEGIYQEHSSLITFSISAIFCFISNCFSQVKFYEESREPNELLDFAKMRNKMGFWDVESKINLAKNIYIYMHAQFLNSF